uniref:Ig-like domain-containing protein n=1 Tax=Amphiprion percula TaxID=161767 RepID=A0A3P8RV50_AMPPE
MIGRFVALTFLSFLSLIQSQQVPQQISLIVVELGDTFTLTCSFSGEQPRLLYWYKLSFGNMFQRVAVGYMDFPALEDQFDSSRFSITKVGDAFSLTIRNISKEDEGTYLCQGGSSYTMAYFNGTLLAVNDPEHQQKSVSVKQSPDVESVRLGNSMTLRCSFLYKNKENTGRCPGEHRVHWFRAGSESDPGVIYTDSTCSNEPEERSCIYRLSKTIRESSDAGTYYCAVATCGQILFGQGTKVETREELCPLVIVIGTVLACSLLVNCALFFTRKPKQTCEHCKGKVTASKHVELDRSAEDQRNNVDGEEVEINYVALDFSSRKIKRWKNKHDLPEDCMYSDMREYR